VVVQPLGWIKQVMKRKFFLRRGQFVFFACVLEIYQFWREGGYDILIVDDTVDGYVVQRVGERLIADLR
jgi:hypothetical protein